MSTFTPNNGCAESPVGYGVTVQQLKEQVQNLTSAVNNIAASMSESDTQHDNRITELSAELSNHVSRINAAITTLTNSKQNTLEAGVDYATPVTVQSAVTNKADVAEVNTLQEQVASNTQTAIRNKAELLTLISSLQNTVSELTSYSERLHLNNVEDYLKLNHAILGVYKAVNYVDFTKIDPTYLVYTDVGGIRYYIFGQLSDNWQHSDYVPAAGNRAKPATIYLKYQNTAGFDAVINAVCTETAHGYNGSITATVSKARYTWEGLAFHLLESTSFDNGRRVIYLAFTCTQSLPEHVAGGLARPAIYAWGTDFIPLKNGSSIMPIETVVKTAVIPFASDAVTVMSDIVINNMTFTQLPEYVEDEKRYILLSAKQLDTLMPVGICMNMWLEPRNHGAIPEGWHACDGMSINDITELTNAEKQHLTERLGSSTLPVADNMIVLCYYACARRQDE